MLRSSVLGLLLLGAVFVSAACGGLDLTFLNKMRLTPMGSRVR